MPARTSPEPAVARKGVACVLTTARPSGAAMTVSGPLSRTTAPAVRRGGAHGFDLAGRRGEQTGKEPLELPGVRREDGGRREDGAQRASLAGEDCQRVGIEHKPAAGLRKSLDIGARGGCDACRRPDDHGARLFGERDQLARIGKRRGHHRLDRLCGNNQRVRRAKQRHKAGADAQAGAGRKPRRAGVRNPAGDDGKSSPLMLVGGSRLAS